MKLCAIFIPTARGVVIERVVMDDKKPALPKRHMRAVDGIPKGVGGDGRFWVGWFDLDLNLRRRLGLL